VTYYTISSYFLRGFGFVLRWLFFLAGTTFGSAAYEPQKLLLLYDYLGGVSWWTRGFHLIISVLCLYFFVKFNVLVRWGKKIGAMERAVDLSDHPFRFEQTEVGVNIHIEKEHPVVLPVGRSVLYLRSFRDDREKDVDDGAENETYEETLALMLSQVGQLVCIGHPAERLPEPGALRLYYRQQDEGWRDIILGMMPVAELVVMRAGITRGLSWEMEQVRDLLPPEKFVLLLLGSIENRLQALKIVEEVMQIDILSPDERLPVDPETGLLRDKVYTTQRGFIVEFDAQWQPKIPIEVSLLAPSNMGCRYFYYETTGADLPLRIAFQPVFQRIGVPMRFRKDWLVIGGMFMLALALLFFLFLYFRGN
jgi:hypothetical protein